ncbi:cell division protein FtsZ [candidate division KSB1 bacterium]|nr:cell division protein FtsZ [candidate division KSB1 bacterium]
MKEDKKITFQSDTDKELEALLKSHKTVIKVIGTGGAGNNTISRLLEAGIDDVQTYAINTDAQDLLFTNADHKILIGREITSGLGAGSDPKVGEDSAVENENEIKAIVSDADLVFVTCGLGGGTGTGSAPIIAELAKEAGALTISITTLPFSEEGVMRRNNAEYGLERLKKNSDTLIVIENDKLLEIDPDVSLDEAFRVADDVLVNAVKGITELVTQKGLVNLDFADIRTIMKDGGTALIGMAESESPDRAIDAVEKAVANPLIDLKIDGAKSALLNITGGRDMTIRDAKTAMHTLARKLDKSAKIIWGARISPDLDKKVYVMVLATGLSNDMIPSNVELVSYESNSKKLVKKTSYGTKTSSQLLDEENDNESSSTKTEAQSVDEEKLNSSKKIFSEIMEEESDADLKILSDVIMELQENITDSDQWEELRKASSSLAGTAQMFDFDDISKTMNLAEDFLASIIYKDLFFEQVLELFTDIPNHLQLMIRNEADSMKWAQEFKVKADLLAKSIRSNDISTKEDFVKELEKINKDMDKHLVESGYDTESGPASTGDSKMDSEKTSKDVSNVNDAMQYVKSLLRKDENPSK